HGAQFLKEKLSYYIKIFLISGALAIFIGILVRFVFGETILLYLGFSPNLSSWNFGDSIPIYHGIQGANIRRFQGIFDGPNQTAFFLITYLGLFIHYLKNKKDVEIYIFLGIFFILGLILLTYSRSSIVGLGGAIFVVFILNIKKIFIKYKFALVCFLIFIFLLGGAFFIKYGNTTENIILRLGSSKGHFERMIIGFDRFKSNPLGEGLASNGPAFRVTHDISNINESYYIPESWYIQQLVEGGIIGLILFLLVMGLILIKIYQLSIPLFMTFLSVLIMNIFLHSFEAVYVTIILFIFLGIFLKNRELRNKN
ncbi:O-antigen ligase family protein, partial [Candidatus Gracilibacteria bacterium]|nr:O-antigen ligase family protein [Candidatus Gracilibacteria bacterium]